MSESAAALKAEAETLTAKLGDAATTAQRLDGLRGKIDGLGVDAVEAEMTELDVKWLKRKLALYDVAPRNGVENMTKIVAGKQLWNYDNLEPAEKKLVL